MNIEEWNKRSQGRLPGLIGIEILEIGHGRVKSRLVLRSEHFAPNGYLHAASVVALADTSCGYGTFASLPEGSTGFTTCELKSNFIGTANDGTLTCEAWLVHGGRTTQVWDAEVTKAADNKVICLFRCTQVLLYPQK